MKIFQPICCILLPLACAAGLCAPVGQGTMHDIRPGPGVASVKHLSNYLPSLANTPGETTVYVLEGKEKGGTVFVAAGTHGNEIAGIMAAILLVERARIQKGRLIVVPHANNSAVGYVDPRRPGPAAITLTTPSGQRKFLCGSRLTKRDDQGAPDPAAYRHPQSTEELDGAEARNLDRAYPGKADGNLTEKIAYAILQLIHKEDVDVAFDLHESGPDSRLAWMVVANPKNVDVAAMAILSLDAAGITMKLEPSSESFRGLSHREWGDASKAMTFLFETPNPGMGEKAEATDPVNDTRFPLARRVGVQLATLVAILDSYNETAASALSIKLQDVPGPAQISSAGVGAFLK
jgi:predicted deacylase